MPKATEIPITNIERSVSGLSNETFLFDMSWREGGRSQSKGMVLRLPPKPFPVHPEYDLNKQFTVMQILGNTDVPVPKVYWMEQASDVPGTPVYVMGKLKGVVPPDYPPYHSFGVYFDAMTLLLQLEDLISKFINQGRSCPIIRQDGVRTMGETASGLCRTSSDFIDRGDIREMLTDGEET